MCLSVHCLRVTALINFNQSFHTGSWTQNLDRVRYRTKSFGPFPNGGHFNYLKNHVAYYGRLIVLKANQTKRMVMEKGISKFSIPRSIRDYIVYRTSYFYKYSAV